MSKKEGFWIRLFFEYGRGHSKTEETYVYLTHEDGYSEKDEEILKSIAHDWAQYDNHGCNLERYEYGFEVVIRPPTEWLEKELIRIMKKYESLTIQENLIRSELGEVKNGK